MFNSWMFNQKPINGVLRVPATPKRLSVPQFIEVRDIGGNTVALLSPKSDGLKNCWIDDEQNGSCTLEFELPLDNPKWQYLTDRYRIYAGGKEFVILNPDAVDKQRDGKKLKGKVKAHESWVLLGKKYQTICNDPLIGTPPWGAVIIVSGGTAHGGFDPGSAGSALSYLLQCTGWTVGTVDVTGTYDLETEKESVLYNINQVQEKWGGILIWDSVNKTVSLRDEATYKPYTGYQIRYAKNLKGITRTDDYDIVTRLYPFGENDLNIANVNGGLLYLDNHSYSDDILEGVWYNQDIADQTQLKVQGERQLAVMCRPRHNYKTEVLDLRSLPGYGHETFKRSDMVDLFDEDFGTDAQVRIIRYRYNVFQPWLCDMELGDPLEKIQATVAQTVLMAKFYKNVVAPNTSFQNLLKAIINTEATEINGASGDYTLVDGVSTWFDRDSETGELTGKLLRITPQGLIISHDGGQTWKLAISGEGIHADAGWVGKLNAGVVTIGPQTTFAPGYDPSQIEGGASMGVDADCLGLWHFDGTLNSHKGVSATFTRASVAYLEDGTQVPAGQPRFEQGKFGQAVLVEEGTTNYLNGASDIASLFGGIVVTKPEVVSPCGDVVIEWTAGCNDDYTNFKGAVSCSAGEKVTVSIWARKISSSAHCEFYFSHDGTYSNFGFSPTLEWQRYSFTITCTGTTTVSTRLDNNIQGDIVQFSGWQLEKKPYPTSFTPSTRSSETLTIPTAGVLNPTEGTISLWVKPPKVISPEGNCLWATSGTQRFDLWWPWLGNDCILIVIGSIIVLYSNRPISSLQDGNFHAITVTWGSFGIKLYIDGVLDASSDVLVPSNLGSDFYVGGFKWAGYESNSIIDELRIDKIARTDEEIAGWYKANAPFYTSEDMKQWPGYVKVETDGLKVYDSSDALRVLVGSWVEDAIRKYGIRIIDGLIEASQIYGTSFQSGQKGATSYVRIGAGFEPIEIVDSGKLALNIYCVPSMGGMLQIYNTSLNDMAGQILPFNDSRGTGLEIHARDNSVFDKDLLITADETTIDSPTTVTTGNLWVDGTLFSGGKSNIEITENYGIRTLVVRESPDHKYIVEGIGEITNGTCRIDIEPMFLECIEPNTVARWVVQLTPYAQASLWVSEIADTYFVVSSDIDQIEFAWTLSAYRKNFADIYLPEYVSKGVR